MSDFTTEEEDTLTGILIFASVFSLCGALFIILVFVFCPKLQNFAFQLVFFMACCDFIHAFGGTMGGAFENGDHDGWCRFQGWVLQFGSTGSVLWTFVITHCIKEVVLSRNQVVEENINYYHCFVWTTNIILSLIPFTTDSYGPSDGWCWIKNNDDIGVAWRMVCFYIPLWSVIIWIIWVYYRTIKQLEDSMQQILERMKYYPAVLIISYTCATINRLTQLFADPIFALACLHALFVTFSGFFNALVYGWTPTVRHEVMSCFNHESAVHQRLIDFEDDVDTYEYHDDGGIPYKPPQTSSTVEAQHLEISNKGLDDGF